MTLSLLEMQLSWGDTLKISGVGMIIVISVLAVIALLIMLVSKVFAKATDLKTGKTAETTATEEESVPTVAPGSSAPVAVAPVVSGRVVLQGVSEKTAAVIMALVSHQTGIPLNRLAFSSIKCLQSSVELVDVDEPTAAVIMAIVSDTSGIPLENLDFTSIKLIKEN